MLVDNMHTVEAGDTLSKIANEYQVSADEIMLLNNLENPNLIYVGDTLIIIPSDTYEPIQIEYNYEGTITQIVTEEEKQLLAQLVYSEANNQPMEGREAIVHVVLNRIDNNDFPDTVEEVIMEKNQFENSSKIPALPITEDNLQAVENAFNNSDNTNGALFFWNPTISDSSYMDSLKVLKVIGDHEFLIEA